MNERMIELMNEANKSAGFTFSMDQAKPVHELMEKFAELIVEECLFIIDDERKPEMVSRIELWKQVKQHFGVEE